MSYSKTIVLILALFLLIQIKSYSQYFAAIARMPVWLTTKQSIFSTQWGVGGGLAGRLGFSNWLYLQGGFSTNKMFSDLNAIYKYRFHTWDCQLGLVPFQKFPFHFSFGTLLHKYRVVTNAEINNGYIFLPSFTTYRKMDGWNIGMGYSLKPWLEVHVRYEKEPFWTFDHPIMANYLRLEVNGVLTRQFRKKSTITSATDSSTSWFYAKPQHSIYFEFLGNGLSYSINYDYYLPVKDKFKISARIGIGARRFDDRKLGSILQPNLENHIGSGIAVPFEINILGGTNHHVETGFGTTLVMHTLQNKEGQADPRRLITEKHHFLRLGYRFQSQQGGLFVRPGIMFTKYQFENWRYKGPFFTFGLALGYTLKDN
jgi:hypothetical protein